MAVEKVNTERKIHIAVIGPFKLKDGEKRNKNQGRQMARNKSMVIFWILELRYGQFLICIGYCS